MNDAARRERPTCYRAAETEAVHTKQGGRTNHATHSGPIEGRPDRTMSSWLLRNRASLPRMTIAASTWRVFKQEWVCGA
jgi:hypothetical protein